MSETISRSMHAVIMQPDYYADERPDEQALSFMFAELSRIPENSIVAMPEYVNAAGLDGREEIFRAMGQTERILQFVSQTAAQKRSYIAVNVLEYAGEDLENHTVLYSPAGERVYTYKKQYLPQAEKEFGVKGGEKGVPCAGVFAHEGIRFGFLTCYDIYFNAWIEHLALQRPDVILFPSYQRGEQEDMIRAQAKVLAYRCNAYVLRSSYSMHKKHFGARAMIIAPDGQVMCELGASVGSASVLIDPAYKYCRNVGFGKDQQVRNDDFINMGLLEP